MLTFKEFTAKNYRGGPKHNNFTHHFLPNGFLGTLIRQQGFVKRFINENREMDALLQIKAREEVARIKKIGGGYSVQFEKELYEAYKILSSYGIPDDKLFR